VSMSNSLISNQAVRSNVFSVGSYVSGRLEMLKKNRELMGVYFLLLDEKSTLMQGTIPAQHLPKYEALLNEGIIYVISGFDVTKSTPRFQLTDFDKSICFTHTTTMVPVDDSFYQIPKQLFRFCSHEELLALANTNKDLPDVLGQVCSSKAYRNESSLKIERMLVQLYLQSGQKVRLSAFDDHAATLNRRMEKQEAGTCIMIATNINPKFFGGELYLNATSGTRFYFDHEIDATRVFAESLALNDKDNKNSEVKYQGVQKIEQVSIAELHQFVTATEDNAEFLCTAKVVDIQSLNGWNYISCSNCAKKMVKQHSSLSCINCQSPGAVGNVRYRVEMVVNDGATEAVFVAFDKDVVKLTNVTATNLTAQLADTNPDLDNETVIPDPISKIVGKTYTFHIKLSSFNFSSHHKSFTVARIFDKPHAAPKPTFATVAHGELSTEIPPNANTGSFNETDTSAGTSQSERQIEGSLSSSVIGAAEVTSATGNENVISKKPKLK
ncbi:unnamed protein product, partial [Thlaspi arvense]